MKPEQKEVMERIKKSDTKLRADHSMPRYSLDATCAPNAYLCIGGMAKEKYTTANDIALR